MKEERITNQKTNSVILTKEGDKDMEEKEENTKTKKKISKKENPKKGQKFIQIKANNQKNKKKIKENIKQMEKPQNKKRKKVIIFVTIGIIILFLLLFSSIFALININNSKIISGVKIEGIDVSGLSKDEAKAKLEAIYNEKKEKEIPIKYNEFESSINPSMIELNYNIEKAVDEAINVGRNNNIFINNYNILFTLIGKKDINVEMTINEEATRKIIEDTGANLPGVVIESSYYIEGENLIITKGKEGIKIDTEGLLTKIKERLDNIAIQNDYIEIPVTTKTPEPIDDTGANLPGVVIESSYYIEGENLIITKGKEGIKIDTEGLLTKIKERLDNIAIQNDYIEIPVTTKTPEPIDVDKIHSEVYKEMQNAYYTKNPFEIHPEVEGVDFNVDEVKAMIAAEDKEEYTVKLTITKPTVTVNDIGTEAFPDKLGTFTTRYDARDTDRTTNLKLACQKLNNQVVLAGATFSYNSTLGERTIAAGYKNAKIYSNGQVVDGLGGGICQISSTLYNAVVDANLGIVERRNHQFVTSYVPAGKDATVVYGMTDFKFKNTRKYPIKIVATAQNGIATISIYGNKEEVEYDVTLEVKQLSTIPTTTQYVEDSSLPVGTEKVKQAGANGVKTETYLVKSLNGKVVSREVISRDTYNAMPRIILKGTKGATNSSSSTSTQKTQTTQTTEQNTQTPTTPTTPTEQQPTENQGQTQTPAESETETNETTEVDSNN